MIRRADPLRASLLVSCPLTKRPEKHWPEIHRRSLAETALEQGWRVVVLGAPADWPAVQLIFNGQAVEDKVEACSLDESATLVNRASRFIGVDTGPTHMDWAFSGPVVASFGSTCRYRMVRGRGGDIFLC